MAKAKAKSTATKTECPISRGDFEKLARSISVVIDGRTTSADPKMFSTGSFGWNINDKGDVLVGDTKVRVQIGMNITVIGSKDQPE